MALAKTNTKIYEADANMELNMQIVSAGNTAAPYSVIYGGGYYVFAGYGESSIQYSTDGEVFQTSFIDFTANDVIYSETLEAFIIVGSRTVGYTTLPVIAKTTDFSTYTNLYYPDAIENNTGLMYGIFEIGNRFFVLSEYRDANYTYPFKAITFNSAFSIESSINVRKAGNGSVSKILKGNNRFLIATIYEGGTYSYRNYFYSVSISGGSSVEMDYTTIDNIPKLLGYANGYFFALCGSNRNNLKFSVDGTTWNTVLNGLYEALDTVVYFKKEYLFICEGKICKRKDICLTADDVFKAVPGLPKTGPGVIANGSLFLLGNSIIKLTADDPDPTVEAEKLSATQALKLSKDYADQLYAALNARVSALEGN